LSRGNRPVSDYATNSGIGFIAVHVSETPKQFRRMFMSVRVNAGSMESGLLSGLLVEQLRGGVTLVQPLEEGSSSGLPYPENDPFPAHYGHV
jgi:hypothetical protein